MRPDDMAPNYFLDGTGQMTGDIVGIQQIIITLVFLGVMVAALVFLKRKGSFIRANLHGDKRIQLVEETAISPTEKLRLIAIDGQMFVMASAKGVQPVLSPLKQAVSLPPLSALQPDLGAKLAAQSARNDATLDGAEQSASPMELTQAVSASPDRQIDEADIKAFQEKFKSWRQR
jgi:hypothetical protein